jgi:hypothetical protein
VSGWAITFKRGENSKGAGCVNILRNQAEARIKRLFVSGRRHILQEAVQAISETFLHPKMHYRPGGGSGKTRLAISTSITRNSM